MAANLAQNADQIAAQDASALRRVFETITAESCPNFYNFHMHTVFSDGQLQPEALMEQAIALGLKGLAITDHHSVDGYRTAQRWFDEWCSTFADKKSAAHAPQLWTGIEINADLLGAEVHILGYAFDPNHLAIQPYTRGSSVSGSAYSAKKVIGAIHEAQGIAVLAHPARYRISHVELIPEAARLGIDGLETYYAYSNPNPWNPSPRQTQEVEQLNETYSLLRTCGTDTHGLSLLKRL